jgi:hypothetical protein
MVSFGDNDKNVQVFIHLPVTNKSYVLKWSCGDDQLYASLLAAELRKQLEHKLEGIRKEEYDRGYKDGRAKRGKSSWFKSWW